MDRRHARSQSQGPGSGSVGGAGAVFELVRGRVGWERGPRIWRGASCRARHGKGPRNSVVVQLFPSASRWSRHAWSRLARSPLPTPSRCPACRKFQPYYQGAAAALAREARVLLARLDCVSNVRLVLHRCCLLHAGRRLFRRRRGPLAGGQLGRIPATRACTHTRHWRWTPRRVRKPNP